jgi:alkylhydroperoxidase/carboxymuconolactone decarboxylase family protein YurZ
MSKEPSAAQKMIGDFAPKLVELTDRVLFGDVWERPQLGSVRSFRSATAVSQPSRLWLQ